MRSPERATLPSVIPRVREAPWRVEPQGDADRLRCQLGRHAGYGRDEKTRRRGESI